MKYPSKKHAAAGLIYVAIIGLLVVAAVASKHHQGGIVGVITYEEKKPNVAEDGRIFYNVSDDKGTDYTIDATGYLNTPAEPSQFGEDCISTVLLDIHKGDKIKFNLPSEPGVENDAIYKVCFSQSDSDKYYIKKLD